MQQLQALGMHKTHIQVTSHFLYIYLCKVGGKTRTSTNTGEYLGYYS